MSIREGLRLLSVSVYKTLSIKGIIKGFLSILGTCQHRKVFPTGGVTELLEEQCQQIPPGGGKATFSSHIGAPGQRQIPRKDQAEFVALLMRKNYLGVYK